MEAPDGGPRERLCATCTRLNPAGSVFCAFCGTPLPETSLARTRPTAAPVVVPSSPILPPGEASPAPAPPLPSGSGAGAQGTAPWSSTTGPDWSLPPEDDTELRRTQTGLLLSAIGFGLSWIPEIGVLGGFLAFVGLIFLFLGRDAFDEAHHRLVVIGAGLFVLSTILITVESVSLAGAIVQAATAPGATPTGFADVVTGDLQAYFLALLVTEVIALVGQVVLIYRLADQIARWTLWLAAASGLGVSVLLYDILLPQIGAAVHQATNGTAIDTGPIDALQNQAQLLGAVKFIPSLLFAYAYWRTRERIAREGTRLPGEAPAYG